MACHEIAALRLGLMHVLGIKDEAEKQHELAELGDAINHPGPIRSLCDAKDLAELKRLFEVALSDLEHRVARLAPPTRTSPISVRCSSCARRSRWICIISCMA